MALFGGSHRETKIDASTNVQSTLDLDGQSVGVGTVSGEGSVSLVLSDHDAIDRASEIAKQALDSNSSISRSLIDQQDVFSRRVSMQAQRLTDLTEGVLERSVARADSDVLEQRDKTLITLASVGAGGLLLYLATR